MVEKINFRDQVRNLLLKKMRTGDLKPTQSLSLAALARELNVSVTPIREALTQLQHSKIVAAIPNRGFIIPELNKVEAKNLYELLTTLEILAVRNSVFDLEAIRKLKKQQVIFEKSKIGITRINADIEFHQLLTSNYHNSLVQQLLSELKTRIFFYEMDFMNRKEFHLDSENHHFKIIEYIEANNIDEATEMLKENWLQDF